MKDLKSIMKFPFLILSVALLLKHLLEPGTYLLLYVLFDILFVK